MAFINKKALKREFAKRGARVGKNVLDFFIKIKEKDIKEDIEKIVRNAKLSGRKTIKKEDIEI